MGQNMQTSNDIKQWKKELHTMEQISQQATNYCAKKLSKKSKSTSLIKARSNKNTNNNNNNTLGLESLFQPRYNCIRLTANTIPKSDLASKLWTLSTKDYNDNDININILRDSHKKYKNLIREYILINGYNEISPKIKLQSKNVKKRITRNNSLNKNNLLKYWNYDNINNIICTKSIKNNSKYTKGCFAKCDIPSLTVLGEYIGVEFLEKEFELIYQNTFNKSFVEKYIIKKKKILNNLTLNQLNMFYNDNNDINIGNNKRKRSYQHDDEDEKFVIDPVRPPVKKRKISSSKSMRMSNNGGLYSKTFILVADPMLLRSRSNNIKYSSLWEINDCRKHIYLDTPSAEDELSRNVVPVYCDVNNWPCMFIIADKLIKKGQQLLSYYGPTYEDNIYAQNIDNYIQNQFANIVNQNNNNYL